MDLSPGDQAFNFSDDPPPVLPDMAVVEDASIVVDISVIVDLTSPRDMIPPPLLGPYTINSVGKLPNGVIAVDLNNDKKLDLAVLNYNAGGKPGSVGVLLGKGDGTFGFEIEYGTGVNPSSLVAGDLNGDGNKDIAVAGSDGTVGVLLGDGTGKLQGMTSTATGQALSWLALGDFNLDATADVAATGSTIMLGGGPPGTVQILLNNNGAFAAPVKYPVDATQGCCLEVVAADLNKDGILDLVASKSTDVLQNNMMGPGSVDVLLGAGNGTFGISKAFLAGANPELLLVADFDRDGNLDALASNITRNQVNFLKGAGDGTFQAPVTAAFPPYTQVARTATADFNRDGKLDLALVVVDKMLTSYVGIALGNGDGTFKPVIAFTAEPQLSAITVGDFNGDQKPDIAVTSYSNGNVDVYLNTSG